MNRSLRRSNRQFDLTLSLRVKPSVLCSVALFLSTHSATSSIAPQIDQVRVAARA